MTIPTKAKIDLAKKMREEPTFWEYLLWMKLRRQKLGVSFYRQRRLSGYIVDFWCPDARLIVEVDGSQHVQPEAVAYDVERDAAFDARGIMTLRFANADVEERLSLVLRRIRTHCNERKSLKGFDYTQRLIKTVAVAVRSEDSENTAAIAPNAEKVKSTVVENRTEKLVTPQELSELAERFYALSRKTVMTTEYVDTRPLTERAWDQRHRLAAWLEKRRTA